MLHLTPDTARALREREALYTDGPEGPEPWATCQDCAARVPEAALVDGLCPDCTGDTWCGVCHADPCACDADCDGAL